MKKNNLFLLAVLLTSGISCQFLGTKSVPLTGNWKLKKANRNGQQTANLDQVFLHFLANNQLETNLPTPSNENAQSLTTAYEIDENNLLFEVAQDEIELTIDKQTEEKLVLSGLILDNEFILEFEKE